MFLSAAGRRWHVGLLALLAASTFDAGAFGGLILVDAVPAAADTLSVGAARLGAPEAPGAGRTKALFIPAVDFASTSGAFFSTEIGAGWNLSHRSDLQFGLRLWPVLGRDDDRSRSRGLGDIGPRLGRGLFLNHEPWQFLVLQSGLLAGSGEHGDGVQFEAGATLGARVGDSVLAGLTLGTTWSNAPCLRSYFGVTPQVSAAGGLPPFAAHAGWSDVNAALSGEITIDPRWKLSGQWSMARLQADARASPVTLSRSQRSFSFALWYALR